MPLTLFSQNICQGPKLGLTSAQGGKTKTKTLKHGGAKAVAAAVLRGKEKTGLEQKLSLLITRSLKAAECGGVFCSGVEVICWTAEESQVCIIASSQGSSTTHPCTEREKQSFE